MTIKELIISESSLTFLVWLMIAFESSCKSHDHLGASYSKIGHIRTKENIAVVTLLIGSKPNSLGGFLIVSESQLNPFWVRLGSYSNQGHLGASCSNIGRIRTKENIDVGTLLIGATPKPLGLYDHIRILT